MTNTYLSDIRRYAKRREDAERHFAAAILRARRDGGLSLRAIAQASGMSHEQVRRIAG